MFKWHFQCNLTDISGMGLNHFMKKLWVIELFWFHFWLGLIWWLKAGKYARKMIMQVCFIAISLDWCSRRSWNTQPSGLVFKQHPRYPANVNVWKNRYDPYTLLQCISMHYMCTYFMGCCFHYMNFNSIQCVISINIITCISITLNRVLMFYWIY